MLKITTEMIENLSNDELDLVYSVINNELSKRDLAKYHKKLAELKNLINEIIKMTDENNYWVTIDSDTGGVTQSITVDKEWGDFSVHLYDGDIELIQK